MILFTQEDSWHIYKFLISQMIKVNFMRIAHVAPVILPVPPATYGGTERVIADLVDAQMELGHEVTLFAAADSGLAGAEHVGAYQSLAWHEREDRSVPPGVVAVLQAAQLADLVQHIARFDVVHLHGSAHASALQSLVPDTPIFRTIHWRADEADHAAHFAQFPGERLIAISNRQARDIPAESLAGMVHHGIPLGRYKAGGGEGRYLAFLGRMTDQKRPDRAIVVARRARMALKLAGPVDPGNPDYFARVVEPELSHPIEHIGNVTDAEKQDFLGNAAALIFPIDWPEPFGLVLIEAMACGTPVIAWPRGSVPELVEDGVTGIIVQSAEEAAARMPEVLALDRAQIRACFESRFAASRMAGEICELYERTLQSVSSPN